MKFIKLNSLEWDTEVYVKVDSILHLTRIINGETREDVGTGLQFNLENLPIRISTARKGLIHKSMKFEYRTFGVVFRVKEKLDVVIDRLIKAGMEVF